MKTWRTLLIYMPSEGDPMMLETDAPKESAPVLLESFRSMGPAKVRGRMHFVFAEPLEHGDWRTITRTARSPFADMWEDRLHRLASDGPSLLDCPIDPHRPWLGFGEVFDMMKANGGVMTGPVRKDGGDE